MWVQLNISPTFRMPHLNKKKIAMRKGDTVQDLLQKTGIPSGACRFIMVGGQNVHVSHQLSDGEMVTLLPFAGGG